MALYHTRQNINEVNKTINEVNKTSYSEDTTVTNTSVSSVILDKDFNIIISAEKMADETYKKNI